ncbi:uncharacterized protein LOC109831126 [Asparagus officinalis]|uniref:uncharacterized protein LOC109831126 n=1 Tax=Asparagus officinalis TaxID=4686 RepID=UPI00098E5AFA|nr:uncharacterized protein LOC109831126 [Asparagus officinalis]
MVLYTPDPSVQQTVASGRVYTVVPHDHGANGAMVEGASHSFISYAFMIKLQLVALPLDTPLLVSIPLGVVSLLLNICRRCIVSLDESEFIVDLIILRMSEFDVILVTSQGNQFAESFLAYVEEVLLRDRVADFCETRVISEYQDVFQDMFRLPLAREIEFCIKLQPSTVQDMFRLPLAREIEFCIKLQPSTGPKSHAPYRMVHVEMRELQT